MQKLKAMGEDDNTIVVFTTDNGTEVFTRCRGFIGAAGCGCPTWGTSTAPEGGSANSALRSICRRGAFTWVPAAPVWR
jgi:arylsulfatase A-like enzyme